LFSLTRKGYRLAEPLEFLDHIAILGSAGDAASRIHLQIVDEIDSTNTHLLTRAAHENAANLPSGTCVVAELQTAGRGRRGRHWQSGLGASLTFSLLWRTEKAAHDLAGLSLVVGLAVAEALRTLGVAAQVKWPNDILLDDKKLGGILIETQGDMLGPTAVVIGIGLNMNVSAQFASTIDQEVIDIASTDATISRNALFGAVLQALFERLDQFEKAGFAALRDRWRALHALEGRMVNVAAPSESYAARVMDVAEDGALLVEHKGVLVRLTSADVSVRVSDGSARKASR
jgi:BirA family transcriptional regulator, biotin operon repressor / biotin---[acetyl-CoA-carboxylase] ligase